MTKRKKTESLPLNRTKPTRGVGRSLAMTETLVTAKPVRIKRAGGRVA